MHSGGVRVDGLGGRQRAAAHECSAGHRRRDAFACIRCSPITMQGSPSASLAATRNKACHHHCYGRAPMQTIKHMHRSCCNDLTMIRIPWDLCKLSVSICIVTHDRTKCREVNERTEIHSWQRLWRGAAPHQTDVKKSGRLVRRSTNVPCTIYNVHDGCVHLIT